MGARFTVIVSPGVQRAVASLGGAVLLVLTAWLGWDTVHTMDGPWGRPGAGGTLTVTQCVTELHGGDDSPTMTCTGTFAAGRSTTKGVRLGIDHVGPWTPGETFQVRLLHGSHTAYRTGGRGWLLRLGFFLALLGAALIAFGRAAAAGRVQAVGGVILLSSLVAPLLILLLYWAF